MERFAHSARVVGADDLPSFGPERPEMPACSSAAAGFSAARPLRNGDPAQELNFRDVVPLAKPVTIAKPPRAGWVL